MNTPPAVSSSRIRAIALACLVLVLVCAAGEVLGGLGTRWGWWDFGAGIRTVQWSAILDIMVALVAAVVAVWAWRRRAGRALTLALAALVLGLAVAGPPIAMGRQAMRVPPIHDISTDTDDPPRFVAVLPLRQGARNGTDYSADTARQQRSGYPDIGPRLLHVPPDKAFAAADRSARAMGWEIVATVPQEGRIEATDTTPLFGFKDDVVIRVAAHPSGTKVDVRSLSRVGVSDIGTNARRVRRYLERLADEASR
jgi:uncharacterized protein (DUF1499 family)